MGRIFEVINRDMVCALGSEKNTLNEGPVFAVQDGFCSYCACASSYNAIVLMDRVDFTRAFGDLRAT